MNTKGTQDVKFSDYGWEIASQIISYDYDLVIPSNLSFISVLYSTKSPKSLKIISTSNLGIQVYFQEQIEYFDSLILLSNTSEKVTITSQSTYIPVKFVSSFTCALMPNTGTSVNFTLPDQDSFNGFIATFVSSGQGVTLTIPKMSLFGSEYQTISAESSFVNIDQLDIQFAYPVNIENVIIKSNINSSSCSNVYIYSNCINGASINFYGKLPPDDYPNLYINSDIPH